MIFFASFGSCSSKAELAAVAADAIVSLIMSLPRSDFRKNLPDDAACFTKDFPKGNDLF